MNITVKITLLKDQRWKVSAKCYGQTEVFYCHSFDEAKACAKEMIGNC